MAIIFWIALTVVCAAAELHTNALVGGFVALGSIVALVAAIGHVNFPLQAGLWLVVSLASTLSLRPLALKRLHRNAPGDLTEPAPTALTGQNGIVVETVGDEVHPGRVTVRSESWKAVTDGPALMPNTSVVVTRARGTTLWVEAKRAD